MRKARKSGFTIVELIIVIAVIGVLAAILIPVFSNVIDKSNAKSAYSDAKNYVTGYVSEATSKGVTSSDLIICSVKGGKIYTHAYDASEGAVVEAALKAEKVDENKTLDEQANEIADKLFALGGLEAPDNTQRFTEQELAIVQAAVEIGNYEAMAVVPNVEVNVEVLTTAQLETTGKFAAGDGTEEKPFIIADEEQFANIMDLSNSMQLGAKEYHFKLMSDIDLNEIVHAGGSSWLPNFCGTIDGAKRDGGNYKLIAPNKSATNSAYAMIGYVYGDTVIKNIEFVQNDDMFTLVRFTYNNYSEGNKLTFENITVNGKTNTTVTKPRFSNQSSFIHQYGGDIEFRNCVNNCSISAGDFYYGLFLGGQSWNTDTTNVAFYNCENNATLSGSQVGFFVGNISGRTMILKTNASDPVEMEAGKVYLYAEDCANNGTIVGTTSCGIFGIGANNTTHADMQNTLVESGAFKMGAMIKGASDLNLSHDGTKYTAGSASQGGLDYKLTYFSYISIPNGTTHFIVDMYFDSTNTLAAPIATGISAVEQAEYDDIVTVENGCYGSIENGEYTSRLGYKFKVVRNDDATVSFVLNKQQIREAHECDAGSSIGVGMFTTTLYGYSLVNDAEFITAAREFNYQNGTLVAKQ